MSIRALSGDPTLVLFDLRFTGLEALVLLAEERQALVLFLLKIV